MVPFLQDPVDKPHTIDEFERSASQAICMTSKEFRATLVDDASVYAILRHPISNSQT